MEYEVLVYRTEEKFSEKNPLKIVCFSSLADAMTFGVMETLNYPIIKIQSENRRKRWVIKKHV